MISEFNSYCSHVLTNLWGYGFVDLMFWQVKINLITYMYVYFCVCV